MFARLRQMGVGVVPKPRQASAQSIVRINVHVEVPHTFVRLDKLVSAPDLVFVIATVCNPDIAGELPFIARCNADVSVLKPLGYDLGRTREHCHQRIVRFGKADL